MVAAWKFLLLVDLPQEWQSAASCYNGSLLQRHGAFGVTSEGFMVTHGIKIVLPVPTGAAKVAEALEFTAEIRSLLNCTQTANGIL